MIGAGRYILNAAHEPVLCNDLYEWARWMETGDEARRVALTSIGSKIVVSTIFLSLDHNFGDGEPILFETMVFGTDEEWNPQERCHTWDQAVAMHARWVRKYGGLREVG